MQNKEELDIIAELRAHIYRIDAIIKHFTAEWSAALDIAMSGADLESRRAAVAFQIEEAR
jgi:hypothetical protein